MNKVETQPELIVSVDESEVRIDERACRKCRALNRQTAPKCWRCGWKMAAPELDPALRL